jgi:hypothetical protein
VWRYISMACAQLSPTFADANRFEKLIGKLGLPAAAQASVRAQSTSHKLGLIDAYKLKQKMSKVRGFACLAWCVLSLGAGLLRARGLSPLAALCWWALPGDVCPQMPQLRAWGLLYTWRPCPHLFVWS